MNFQKPLKDLWFITQKFHARHGGIDLRTKNDDYPNGIGMPIYAAEAGIWEKVAISKRDYGNYVIINHGAGFKTLYAHLSKTNYKKGYKEIKKGDCLGYSGNNGRSTGPHLHFELILNNKRINPITFLN